MEVTWEKDPNRYYFVALKNGEQFAEVFWGRTKLYWVIVYGLAEPTPWKTLVEAQRFVKDMAFL